MGTRGWLVFRYKGKYYVLYNWFDSYPSAMGYRIAAQLVTLVRSFHGDIRSACAHWGELLSTLKVGREHEVDFNDDENERPRHPFSDSSVFMNIENALHDQTNPVPFLEEPSTTMMDVDSWTRSYLEYVWEIDLDIGSLSLMEPPVDKISRTWSMKSFYLMTMNGTNVNLSLWVADAEPQERENEEEEELTYSNSLKVMYSIVLFQALVRRYLAVKRALEPGTGVLYLVARKRFED